MMLIEEKLEHELSKKYPGFDCIPISTITTNKLQLKSRLSFGKLVLTVNETVLICTGSDEDDTYYYFAEPGSPIIRIFDNQLHDVDNPEIFIDTALVKKSLGEGIVNVNPVQNELYSMWFDCNRVNNKLVNPFKEKLDVAEIGDNLQLANEMTAIYVGSNEEKTDSDLVHYVAFPDNPLMQYYDNHCNNLDSNLSHKVDIVKVSKNCLK